MGRYTTVQTYTDNSERGVAPRIPYDQATGGRNAADPEKPVAGFKVQKVENVSGSSAGAGSGEFHMYRAARRKEIFRIERMEQEYKQKTEQELLDERRKLNQMEAEERTRKRADKRKKKKAARARASKQLKVADGTHRTAGKGPAEDDSSGDETDGEEEQQLAEQKGIMPEKKFRMEDGSKQQSKAPKVPPSSLNKTAVALQDDDGSFEDDLQNELRKRARKTGSQ